MLYLGMDMNEDHFTYKNQHMKAHIELNEPKKNSSFENMSSLT